MDARRRDLDRPTGHTRIAAGATGATLAPNPYLAFALRWWWALAAGLALGAVGGLAYPRVGPVSYQSTVQVMVPSPGDPASDTIGSPGTVRAAAANFVAQAASTQVLARASAALPGSMALGTADLLQMMTDRSLTIGSVRGSNFIDVTAQDRRPERAQLLATTLADQFVQEVNGRAADEVATRKQQLEQQIALAREQLTTAQLHQKEIDLTKELRDERAVLLQIQTNYQQELGRAAPGDPLAPVGAPPTGALTDAAARVAGRSLTVLGDQQKDLEKSVADAGAQLAAVRAGLTSDASPELRQHEQELATTLQAQRTQLLQANQAYQQELQRLAAAGQERPAPGQERQRQELADASARVHDGWLKLMDAQQADVAQNVADLEGQLADVREKLAAHGGDLDPAVAAAFATAYAAQLSNLTQVYTTLQMNAEAQTTTEPVQRYGDASPPVATLTARKTLPIGAGAGLALGAGAAGLLELRRRRATGQAAATGQAVATDEAGPDAATRTVVPASARPSAGPVGGEDVTGADLRRLAQLRRLGRPQSDRISASRSSRYRGSTRSAG